MLPTGLIIGVQKAGTSWIDRYLRQRGDVTLPAGVKETRFFDRHFDRGLEWYGRHFDDSNRCCIEVAPTLLNCPAAPRRVHESLGPVPLVCVLREPVARTWSLYLHRRRYGLTRETFLAELQRNPGLIDSARYASLLRPWFDAFGRRGVRVLLYEDLLRDPQAFADALCGGLGLPPATVGAGSTRRVNAADLPRYPRLAALATRIALRLRAGGSYRVVNAAKALGLKRLLFSGGSVPHGGPTPAERQFLERHFAGEVAGLRELLDRPLNEWKKPE